MSMELLVIDESYVVYGGVIAVDDEELLLSTSEMLNSARYRNEFNKDCNNCLQIAATENGMPFIMMTDLVEKNVVTVSQEVLECAKEAFLPKNKLTEEEKQSMYDVIVDSHNEDVADVLKHYFKEIEVYQSSLGESTFVDFGDNPITACISVNDYKQLSKYAGSVNYSSNDAVMESPTDKVSFKVPDYTDLDTKSLKYPNFPAYILNYTTIELKKAGRSAGWRDICTDETLPLIMGSVENNNLPIQDNEMDYYNDLCYLMRRGIEIENPGKDVEQLIKVGVISEKVFEYLINCCHLALKTNWMHTGKVCKFLYEVKDVDPELLRNLDREDDSDSDRNSIDEDRIDFEQKDSRDNTQKALDALGETNGGYYCVPTSSKEGYVPNTDAKLVISGYLRKSNNTFASCEALIKLLRWGIRKPTKLKVTGADKYVDLTTFKMSISDGDVSKMEQIVYEDGSNCICFEGISLCTKNMTISLADMSNYCKELGLPDRINGLVGLRLITRYEGSPIVRVNATDFLAIIEEYVINENKNYMIANIEYDKEAKRFNVFGDVQDVIDKNSVVLNQSLADKQTPEKELVYLTANAVKDVAMTSDVHLSSEEDRRNITVLGLVPNVLRERNISNQIQCNVFSSKEELDEALKSSKCTSRKESLTWTLIDSFVIEYLSAIVRANTYDLEELLNKLINDEAFMNLLNLESTLSNNNALGSPKQSTAFGSETTTKVATKEQPQQETPTTTQTTQESTTQASGYLAVIDKDYMTIEVNGIEVGFIVMDENKNKHVYPCSKFGRTGNKQKALNAASVVKILSILMERKMGVEADATKNWTFYNGKVLMDDIITEMFKQK